MSKITFTIGIIISAMIFEKSPTIGIAIIATNIIFTIEKGCKKISQAITEIHHPKNEFENEYITRNDPKVKIYTRNIYKY